MAKRGCFVFGNSMPDPKMQIEQLLLPRLITLNSVNFDARECNYGEENNKKDKRGDCRSGSGRATIYNETGLPHCFTLEANYTRGVRINTLQARHDVHNGNRRILKEDHAMHDTSSACYKKRKLHHKFTGEVFKDVGAAFCLAILDMQCLNPLTRIVKSESETPE